MSVDVDNVQTDPWRINGVDLIKGAKVSFTLRDTIYPNRVFVGQVTDHDVSYESARRFTNLADIHARIYFDNPKRIFSIESLHYIRFAPVDSRAIIAIAVEWIEVSSVHSSTEEVLWLQHTDDGVTR